MDELLLLINKDIRPQIDNPPLSKFNFLIKTEEDALAEGTETEHWFTDQAQGLQIKCSGLFLIKVIFLNSGRKKGEKVLAYPYQVAEDLTFEDTKTKVQTVLGQPSLSGKPNHSKILGVSDGFDRYDFNDWSIHFEYSPADERIDLITLMSSDVVP